MPTSKKATDDDPQDQLFNPKTAMAAFANIRERIRQREKEKN